MRPEERTADKVRALMSELGLPSPPVRPSMRENLATIVEKGYVTKGFIPVSDFITREDSVAQNNTAAASALQKAIDLSWDYTLYQYQNAVFWWTSPEFPEGSGNTESWGKSSESMTLPVMLPPWTMQIGQPIFLPPNVPLLGVGGGEAFTQSQLRFHGAGSTLYLEGNLFATRLGCAPFHQLRGGVHGVKLVPHDTGAPTVIFLGDLSNYRFEKNHIISLSNRTIPAPGGGQTAGPTVAIDHFLNLTNNPQDSNVTYHGFLIYGSGGQQLKEVTVADNQIEGASIGVRLVAAIDSEIRGNKFIYAQCPIWARNNHFTSIIGNNLWGTGNGGIANEPFAPLYGIVASGYGLNIQGNLLSGFQPYAIVTQDRPATSDIDLFVPSPGEGQAAHPGIIVGPNTIYKVIASGASFPLKAETVHQFTYQGRWDMPHAVADIPAGPNLI